MEGVGVQIQIESKTTRAKVVLGTMAGGPHNPFSHDAAQDQQEQQSDTFTRIPEICIRGFNDLE